MTAPASVSVRDALAQISRLDLDVGDARIGATVAAELTASLCPLARPGTDPAAPRSLRVVLAAGGTEKEGAWMRFRLDATGGGELAASRPHLLYALLCVVREQWLEEPAAAFAAGRTLELSLEQVTARDDLLVGRKPFLRNRREPVSWADIEASMQEMARIGAARVVVNELGTPFGQETGPEGEVYYRFYDYLPDLDQFVETKLNRGTYPPERLEANLNSLKKLARLADKYGLVPGMEIANPRSVPESLLQRYPFLRGARVDHPFRCFRPRYTLTLAHPAVRWHYAELLRTLLREVPELGFVTTLINDSGAGFEFTESLYPGRNGGPYVVKEWMPGEVIAKAAAENVVRYYRMMRNVAHETHPHFRIITGLKNIAEESRIITAGIDNGIDLRMNSQRDDVDTGVWKKQLQEVRQKQSDFVTDANARATPYVLGVPSPWLTFENLARPETDGFSQVDVTVDPPFLVARSVNREVVRAFQLDRTCDVDKVVENTAVRWVGQTRAAALIAIWRAVDEVARMAPCHKLYGGLGFTWYRFWVRPFVPDIEAIPEPDRRYYEKHFLSHFNNPHNIDLAADMLWTITTREECERSLQCFDEKVWPLLDDAIAQAAAQAKAGEDDAAEAFFEETRQRLLAYRCYNRTLRNLCAWVEGVHGYLTAEDEAEKSSRLDLVREMVANELGNTQDLLELWETATVDFMPINAYGETMHDYGPNFGELLRLKITLMERFGDRRPAIDPHYMWRMPDGSPIREEDYLGY